MTSITREFCLEILEYAQPYCKCFAISPISQFPENSMSNLDAGLLDQITQKLHADGGRMTAQRRLILEVLDQYTDHPTAEEVYLRARLRDETLHLSTVYRTLRWLEDNGYVNTRWFDGDRRQERFDTVTSSEHDHYHFRCRHCNEIIEFPEPLVEQIKAHYEAVTGCRVDSAELNLYGVCMRCSNGQ